MPCLACSNAKAVCIVNKPITSCARCLQVGCDCTFLCTPCDALNKKRCDGNPNMVCSRCREVYNNRADVWCKFDNVTINEAENQFNPFARLEHPVQPEHPLQPDFAIQTRRRKNPFTVGSLRSIMPSISLSKIKKRHLSDSSTPPTNESKRIRRHSPDSYGSHASASHSAAQPSDIPVTPSNILEQQPLASDPPELPPLQTVGVQSGGHDFLADFQATIDQASDFFGSYPLDDQSSTQPPSIPTATSYFIGQESLESGPTGFPPAQTFGSQPGEYDFLADFQANIDPGSESFEPDAWGSQSSHPPGISAAPPYFGMQQLPEPDPTGFPPLQTLGSQPGDYDFLADVQALIDQGSSFYESYPSGSQTSVHIPAIPTTPSYFAGQPSLESDPTEFPLPLAFGSQPGDYNFPEDYLATTNEAPSGPSQVPRSSSSSHRHVVVSERILSAGKDSRESSPETDPVEKSWPGRSSSESTSSPPSTSKQSPSFLQSLLASAGSFSIRKKQTCQRCKQLKLNCDIKPCTNCATSKFPCIRHVGTQSLVPLASGSQTALPPKPENRRCQHCQTFNITCDIANVKPCTPCARVKQGATCVEIDEQNPSPSPSGNRRPRHEGQGPSGSGGSASHGSSSKYDTPAGYAASPTSFH
ncbi:hypothetical protein DL96DRAFT_1632085 [Flagelloscypha sp. PMI_526]|nr:hypothetical protein DL96DRAFT_1632085 [Flagelloscypha sp. PMI_526]